MRCGLHILADNHQPNLRRARHKARATMGRGEVITRVGYGTLYYHARTTDLRSAQPNQITVPGGGPAMRGRLRLCSRAMPVTCAPTS